MLKLTITKEAKVKNLWKLRRRKRLKHASLIEGAEISTMAELTNWVVDSDKVLTF